MDFDRPRAARVVRCIFAIAFSGMLFSGIRKETAQIDFHLLVSALRATPTTVLAAALAATALSYLALVGYDVSGLRYARARAPLKTILLTSSAASPSVTALVWAPSQAEPCVIACILQRNFTGPNCRAILFISIAFGVGLGVIAALGLLLDAKEVSGLLGASVAPLRAGAAAVLALAIGFMVFCASRRGLLAPRPNRNRCARHNASAQPAYLHNG